MREAFMQTMCEAEDFPVDSAVLTPSGRRAVVIKHLTGASKFDHFTRLMLRYEGGGRNDVVTLQPHQLRPAPPLMLKSRDFSVQASLDF